MKLKEIKEFATTIGVAWLLTCMIFAVAYFCVWKVQIHNDVAKHEALARQTSQRHETLPERTSQTDRVIDEAAGTGSNGWQSDK